MNFKTMLTLAILVTGGLTATAQEKAATTKASSVSQSKSFTAKISAYEKATDKVKEKELLETLTMQVRESLGTAKEDIVNAQNSGNTQEVEKLNQQLQKRAEYYNKLVQVTSAQPDNKKEIIAILKSFAQELK